MIEEKIIEKIFELYRLVKSEAQVYLEKQSLSWVQIHTLFFLDQEKNLNHNDLAKMLKVSLPTVSDLTNRLVAQKYLERAYSPADRRVIFIKLTPKGKKLVAELKKVSCRKWKEKFTLLSQKEKEQLFNLLNKLIIN